MSTTAARLDLCVVQNARFQLTLKLSQNDSPIDLTGRTLKGHARRTIDDEDLVIDFGAFTTVIDAAGGELSIVIPASTTKTYDFDRLKYDYFADDDKLLVGEVELERSVTTA